MYLVLENRPDMTFTADWALKTNDLSIWFGRTLLCVRALTAVTNVTQNYQSDTAQ